MPTGYVIDLETIMDPAHPERPSIAVHGPVELPADFTVASLESDLGLEPAEDEGDLELDGDEDDEKPVVYANPRTTCDPTQYRPEWAAWIAEHYGTPEDASCRCCSASHKMAEAFPEQLRAAAGYFGIYGIEHAWCVDLLTGNVVDPTAAQFTKSLRYPAENWTRPGAYQELTQEEIEQFVPSGVCMDCGEPVYHKKTFCSESCERATMAYLNSAAASYGGPSY